MLSVKGNLVSLGPWFPTRTRLQCCAALFDKQHCNCMQLPYVSLNYITLLDSGPAMHHKMLQKWRFSDGTRYELKEISPGLASPVKRWQLELLDDIILLEMKLMPWYSVAVSSFPYHRWLQDVSTCKQHEFMRSHKSGYDMGRKGSSTFGLGWKTGVCRVLGKDLDGEGFRDWRSDIRSSSQINFIQNPNIVITNPSKQHMCTCTYDMHRCNTIISTEP